MYALLLSMVSLVIEVSPTWVLPEMWNSYVWFSIWMYGFAIIFFIYLYFFVINPVIIQPIVEWIKVHVFKKPPNNNLNTERPVFHGEGAGTLYLRLGAVFFGLAGSMIWGTEIVLCFSNVKLSVIYVIKYFLALQFTVLQMVFIFFFSKTTIKKSNVFARIGLMHCVAVNLWSWFSLCMAKGVVKTLKKKKKYAELAAEAAASSGLETSSLASDSGYEVHGKNLRTLIKLGGGSNILLTSLVEFSLIGAAVCFIIWKAKDHDEETMLKHREKKEKTKFEFKHYFEIFKNSFKGTWIGIILGVLLHAVSIVTMTLHGVYTRDHFEYGAEQAIGWAEVILFAIGILAVIFGFIRIRNLEYRLHAHNEVIDDILLIVGLAGEVIYSSIGLDVFLEERVSEGSASTIVLSAFILRITQVIIQTVFILILSRLRCLSRKNMENMPGKQTLAFLFLLNINLFIYHSFEAMESSFGFPSDMPVNYSSLMVICSPVVVFYRFHSSAYFAEIWKHTYSNTDAHRHNTITKVEKFK